MSTKTIFGLDEGHFGEDDLDEDHSWTLQSPFRRRENVIEDHFGEDNLEEDHS